MPVIHRLRGYPQLTPLCWRWRRLDPQHDPDTYIQVDASRLDPAGGRFEAPGTGSGDMDGDEIDRQRLPRAIRFSLTMHALNPGM